MVNTTKSKSNNSQILPGRGLEQNPAIVSKPSVTPKKSRVESALSPRMALVKIETNLSPEEIAIAAYYKAEQRGFDPGGEVEDWLAAEREMSGLARRK